MPDLLGEAVRGEVGADGFGGVAADYGGCAPGVPAGGERLMYVCGGSGCGGCGDFEAGELAVDACRHAGADACRVGENFERVAGVRDGRWEIRVLGAQDGAELFGGGGWHGGG